MCHRQLCCIYAHTRRWSDWSTSMANYFLNIPYIWQIFGIRIFVAIFLKEFTCKKCTLSSGTFNIRWTALLRNLVDELFITCNKPFRAATTQSLARWLKITLDKIGIDNTFIKAHSTRHASSSASNRHLINPRWGLD